MCFCVCTLIKSAHLCLCLLPVVQDEEADDGGSFFGLQWNQGEQSNNNVTQ